jgi:hypothetical protein
MRGSISKATVRHGNVSAVTKYSDLLFYQSCSWLPCIDGNVMVVQCDLKLVLRYRMGPDVYKVVMSVIT